MHATADGDRVHFGEEQTQVIHLFRHAFLIHLNTVGLLRVRK